MNSAPSPNTLNMTSAPLEHNGARYDFTFTWGVFETLQAEWGDAYQNNLADLFTKGDMTHLRLVASLASGHTFDRDTVLPVQKTVNTLYRAYELAWSGRDVGQGPEEASKDNGKKPRPFAKLLTTILTPGWLWGSRGASSSL